MIKNLPCKMYNYKTEMCRIQIQKSQCYARDKNHRKFAYADVHAKYTASALHRKQK